MAVIYSKEDPMAEDEVVLAGVGDEALGHMERLAKRVKSTEVLVTKVSLEVLYSTRDNASLGVMYSSGMTPPARNMRRLTIEWEI